MRIIIVVLLLLQFCLTGLVFAQGSIPCCDEEFPYTFCPSGLTRCSKNPTQDPNGTPAKSYLPGSVCVFQMGENGIYQPKGAPTNPPVDYTYYGGSYTQWLKDIDAFNKGLPIPEEPIYTCGEEPNDFHCIEPFIDDLDEFGDPKYPLGAADPAYLSDLHDFWECRNEYMFAFQVWDKCAKEQWRVDNFYFLDAENNYTKVWDQSQANSDANSAYQHWLGLCNLEGQTHSNCCLNIMGVGDPDNFSNSGFDPKNTLAVTIEVGCNETTCPDRWIEVNLSPPFLYQTNNPNATSDPKYTYHSVPRYTFFTGSVPPSPIASGYGGLSFYQLMEHEIGHFLGMHHPNDLPCNNNANHGNPQVMSQGQNTLNGSPKNLTSDDECEFKKLYCNPCISKVGEEHQNIQPEIYPNPSTDATTLRYHVYEASPVLISLYDILGKEIIEVSSGKQTEGYYQVSLPTHYLGSGNYFCRIKIGKKQYNLKLSLTK